MKDLSCTICSTAAEGSYCENCGQSINNPDTTFWGMIKDLFSSALDIDKSVILNVFSIPFNPNKMIVNYWNGNRKYYPSPFKVLIYALVLAGIHITYVNPTVMGINLNTKGINAEVGFWIIILPLLTITSYLTFIRRKMSFTKHLISLLYIAGSFFIILTLLDDLIFLSIGFDLGNNIFIAFLILVFLFNSFVFSLRKKTLNYILNAFLQLIIFASIIVLIIGILSAFPGALSLNNK